MHWCSVPRRASLMLVSACSVQEREVNVLAISTSGYKHSREHMRRAYMAYGTNVLLNRFVGSRDVERTDEYASPHLYDSNVFLPPYQLLPPPPRRIRQAAAALLDIKDDPQQQHIHLVMNPLNQIKRITCSRGLAHLFDASATSTLRAVLIPTLANPRPQASQ